MSGAPRWIKKGVIFAPEGNAEWLSSHAALPVADRSDDDLYRIYFSARDRQGRARVGYFDFDLEAAKVRRVSAEPVIDLGPLGAFDDSGVTTSCIVSHEAKKYHYYSGWTLGTTVPFYFFVGLAISKDGGQTYQRVSAAPILERNAIDPYLTASPSVLVEEGLWRMWYVSGTDWTMCQGNPRHYYHIKYAESADGIHWKRDGVVCIDYETPGEYAFARPCVIKEEGVYKMWYSYRGGKYKIGYAESADGLSWTRKDGEAGIDISESGWDSEMIEYPYVFDHKGNRYMLYNGNGYGQTGIGLALLDRSAR